MDVSVAMATYNGARYLEPQLESIAGQSELPVEIVISDDNSSDATLEVAQRFARTAPFEVRVLPRHERLGFADNFLHAAENCRSPLIMFCDQDDVWHADKLARSRERLMRDDSLMLLHTLALVNTELQPIGAFTQGISESRAYGPLELEPYLCGHGNTMMFRRELTSLISRGRRPNVAGSRLLSHDTWLYTLAAALGNVSHLDASLISYRQHDENVSSLDDRTLQQKVRDLLTFAVSHHEQQADFNGVMAGIFDEIAGSRPEWQEKAHAAARCYRQREIQVRERVNLYRSPSLTRRLKAFASVRTLRQAGATSRKSTILAEAKDLLLGVGGLGLRT
jgi:glycosyltransferase involved in cell wall biosynthesis